MHYKLGDESDKHIGWSFSTSALPSPSGKGSFHVEGCTGDMLYHHSFVRDLYESSNDVLGKYTVPILWILSINA